MSSVLKCACCPCCYKKDSFTWQDTPKYYMPSAIAAAKVAHSFIASSHNTYIDSKLQILGNANEVEVQRVLYMGARALELDIWSKSTNDSTPVVAHGGEYGKYDVLVTPTIDFSKYLDIIAQYGWRNSNLPLFLCLELNGSDETNARVAQLIRDRITPRLFGPQVELGQTQYQDIKDKLVICSSGCDNPEMNSLVNYHWTTPAFRNINYSTLDDYADLADFSKEHIVRVYPGNKVLSRNYDPAKPWNLGCQMVAINYNYEDDGYKTNQTMFEDFPVVLKA